MASSWKRVAEDLGKVTATLPWGSYVIVDYDAARLGSDCPYVQAAPGPSGWYAETASSLYVSDQAWPLDLAWLHSREWNAPDASTGNWWKDRLPPEAIVDGLLDGLRCARTCLLPDVVTFTTGRFPPSPDGGLPSSPPLPEAGGRFAA